MLSDKRYLLGHIIEKHLQVLQVPLLAATPLRWQPICLESHASERVKAAVKLCKQLGMEIPRLP